MPKVFVNSNSEFYNTYKLYREYIGFKDDYTYRQWLRLPDKFKAAALYVQFYNEITLAWYKVKTDWSFEEEGVECINQYLIKNVEKIKKDKKRFTPQYIYKVAYNCLYCVCIDPSKNKDRYYSETSETFETGDDSLSWFDFIGETESYDDEFDVKSIQDFIESLDDDLQIYIQHFLHEISDIQTLRQLKKFGYISGSTRDKDYGQKVLEMFDEYGKNKLKLLIELNLNY